MELVICGLGIARQCGESDDRLSLPQFDAYEYKVYSLTREERRNWAYHARATSHSGESYKISAGVGSRPYPPEPVAGRPSGSN